MECPTKSGEGPELFITYAAGALPPPTEAALERHLMACPECRRVADAQKLVWATLDSWEPQYISTDFDRKLYARIAAEERKPWYHRLPHLNGSFRPTVAVAAACAIVLTGYLLREPSTESSPEPRAAIENRVDIEQVERALDDIDMLNAMGVVMPPSATSPAEPL
jgi:anti-sigma factor RsiW